MSKTTFSDSGSIIHVLRNPWGFPEETVRQARLCAADMLERYERFGLERALGEFHAVAAREAIAAKQPKGAA